MESPYVRVVSDTEPIPSPPDKPALSTGFEPDRFQKFAIDAIEAGENVLCVARTGSGKTFVGEYQIAKSLQRGGRIFYTTPVKSLSNQKFNDLKKLFPQSSVGIMTGDIKFRPDAQIIVMTTEILRNLLFKKGTATESVGTTALLSLNGLDSVIFDEVHYINDVDRGHVWEESLILLPPSVKLILLSATLSSPFGFAKWLGESKKVRVWLISTLWRAVPLQHCVLSAAEGAANQKIIYDSKESFHADVYSRWLAERDGALLAHDKFKEKVKALKSAGHEGAVGGKMRPKSFEHDMNACLGALHEKAGLPAIVFVFSRAGCEKLADKVEHNFLDSSDSAAVAHIWDFHLSRYRETLEKSSQTHKLRELAMKGIAFHHSGLLPFLKEILEILFSRGLIKVLFATETFAVGINMPTKTVIFTALEKFTDGSIRLLKSAEYIQMAGRAGRRGKDDRGLVIYLPQRDPVTVTEMKQIICGKAATFGSRMNFHYDFLLKIMNTNGTSGDETSAKITEQSLVESSYWWALEHEAYLSLQRDAEHLSRQIAEIPLTAEQAHECHNKEDIERRISETQNAKKKAAQRELVIWEDGHRVSVWTPILERFHRKKQLEKELCDVQDQCNKSKGILWTKTQDCGLPGAVLRKRVLEEYGYVKDGQLTSRGLLASEVNEGHPFMMTELFLELRKNLKPVVAAAAAAADVASPLQLTKQELLTVLAVFLGEPRDDVMTKTPDSLDVSSPVKETLWFLNNVARDCSSLEAKVGVPYEPGFWDLSTEWVEPVSEWLEGEISLPEIAVKYEIFEGNMMKALMKLSGLLDEFQSMAALMGELEWLAELQEARQLILRDIVIAESLYLRI
jgi:superfamily II RNA helicase